MSSRYSEFMYDAEGFHPFADLHLSHGKSAAQSLRCLFRIGGISSAGGHGRPCLTVTQSKQAASSFQHQHSRGSLAQAKWACFHCRSREADDALTV